MPCGATLMAMQERAASDMEAAGEQGEEQKPDLNEASLAIATTASMEEHSHATDTVDDNSPPQPSPKKA